MNGLLGRIFLKLIEINLKKMVAKRYVMWLDNLAFIKIGKATQIVIPTKKEDVYSSYTDRLTMFMVNLYRNF